LEINKLMAKSQRWQKTALFIATAMTLGTWGSQAFALSLGRLAVLSALGEPLRAEIEILDINSEESSSLKASLAKPDAFRTAGLEYNSSLTGLQITLQQRGDGRSYLRLSNPRPINDPYVDLMLEASWSTGRIVRDFTMLFDPPALKPSQGAIRPVVVPQVTSVPIPIAPSPQAEPQPVAQAEPAPVSPPLVETPVEPPSPVTGTQEPSPPIVTTAPVDTSTPDSPAEQEIVQTSPVAPATPVSQVQDEPVAIASQPIAITQPDSEARAAQAGTAAVGASKVVVVKPGDTAGKIATAQKMTGVSLDQLLVAMQRTNPQAFVSGNVNRLRSGVVLNMPEAEEAQVIPANEARQIIVAQSRDFNEFRSKLASSAPIRQPSIADRQASGVIESKVEEKKAPASAPDRLTLSKGAVVGKAPEDKVIKELGTKEAAIRAEEVSKNIADLNKLSTASAPTAAPTAAATPKASPVPEVAKAPVIVPAKPEVPATPAIAVPAVSSPAPVASSPAPEIVAAAPAAAPVRRAAPVAPPKPAAEPDLIDELLDNPMVPAAAGGLVVLLAGLAYFRSRQRKKNSQIDSAYLESRLQPDSFFGASGGQRIDTNDSNASGSSMVYSPSQLDAADDVDPVAEADVYLAYGRDMQAEEILKEAMRTHPSRVAIHLKLLEIYAKRRDIKNFGTIAKTAFKLSGSNSQEWEHVCELGRSIDPSNTLYSPGGVPANSGPAPLAEMDGGFASSMPRASASAAPAPPAVNVDLDLDFSMDESAPSAAMEAVDTRRSSISSDRHTHPGELTGGSTAPSMLSPSASAGMMNFDLGALSGDISAISEQPSSLQDDPLGTKLALAEEFKAIGDTDGARALIEEIIAESSGEMKSRAQKALSQLA
jgi:pilus assembly protein FimV